MKQNCVRVLFGLYALAMSFSIGAGASNQFSDHPIVSITNNKNGFKVVQCNMAQIGRLQMFPGDVEGTFEWSSTYRTPDMLRLLAENKEELNTLGAKLLKIAKDSNLSLAEKNQKIKDEAGDLVSVLNEIGIGVKGFSSWPTRLFNPTADRNDLAKNPEKYVQAPVFMLEDAASFKNRLKTGFFTIFNEEPDIVTTQEIELGQSEGIEFTKILTEVMKLYPDYDFTLPSIKGTSVTTNITFIKREMFSDVSNTHQNVINILKEKFKIFSENENKVIISVLKHNQTHDLYGLVNLHAEYSKTNKIETHKTLNGILLAKSDIGLIVSGDFNLKKASLTYFETAAKNLIGQWTFAVTPEPEDVGNPTADAIFIKYCD